MLPQLILASTSPRRIELLTALRIPFETASPTFDERAVPFDGEPVSHVRQLAEGKARSVGGKGIILAADTIVYSEGRLFHKPGTRERAKESLSQLVGKSHTVLTGVCAFNGERTVTEVRTTEVTFYDLTPQQVDHYVQVIDPTDKAGGYAIQGAGGLIVKSLSGCYSNVIGLPLHAAALVLKQFGLDVWHSLDWDYSS